MAKEENLEEHQVYLELFKTHSNIGSTIQCYQPTVDEYVDKVLEENGHIRLVKGFFNDGELSMDVTTCKYISNAEKLLESGGFHQIATHDFTILEHLYSKYNMDTVQIAFFGFVKSHVYRNLKSFPYTVKNKMIYYPFGNACIWGSIRTTDFKRSLGWLVA